MSRHRNAYDKDDLYDYDDYDDDDEDYVENEDEDYDEELEQEEALIESAYKGVDVDEATNFIYESLNEDDDSAGKVSAARIKQMLVMYGNDVEKTLEYFLNRKAGVVDDVKSKDKTPSKSQEKTATKKTPAPAEKKHVPRQTAAATSESEQLMCYASDDDMSTIAPDSAAPHLNLVVAGHIGECCHHC